MPPNSTPWAIRIARPEDAGAMLSIYAPFVRDSAVTFETEVPTERDMASRIEETLRRFPWLVAEREGKIVGYAYAGLHRVRHAYRWSCEVSIYLDAAVRGRGLGRALYERLIEHLRDLGYLNAYGGAVLPNDASVKLHESLGFEPVGVYRKVGYKQGRFWDVGWWALRLAEPEGVPAEPRAFGG